MAYLWALILLVLGIVMLLKPEWLWKIEHIFTVKNGEPTDLYLALMRVGGILLIGTIVIVVLSALFA